MRLVFSLMLAMFSWCTFAVEFEAGPSGGGGGSPFFDNPPSDYLQIDSIRLCGGTRVDSIEMSYSDELGNVVSYGKHGGGGGTCNTLFFSPGEFITKVSGRYGDVVDSISITTNFGRVISTGGSGGFASFAYTGNDQFQIVGFKGRSARLIDSVGVVYFQTY